MAQGMRMIVYPVRDLAQAKRLYSTLLGVEPYVDGAWVKDADGNITGLRQNP